MAIALPRYLACLGVVLTTMALYCAMVVPWLEPEHRAEGEILRSVAEEKTQAWWSHLFAADAWQNAEPMLIQTKQGTLLFKKLDQLGPNTYRLSPLSLIIPLSHDGKAALVGDINAASRLYQNSSLAIVIAQEGADIQFRDALDLTSGSTPPVTGGLLRGPIQITGIDPQQQNAIQWTVKTSNVRIDRRQVWTNNDVDITFGNSIASGKDLSIFLKHDLLSKPTSNDGGAWDLLDNLKLIYVKRVSVALGAGGLWKNLKVGSPAMQAAHAQVPAQLNLQCKGMFQFNFNQSLARLTDHIHIEHRYQGETAADQLLCHELVAQLEPPMAGAAMAPNAVTVGPMQVKMIDMIGIESADPLPAQSTVQVDAPNIATQLTARHVRVQLDKRQFTLDAPTSIMLSYMGHVFRAPSLEYAAAPNDEHLGWLFASGPGEVETTAQSALGHATARWQQSLKMQPAEQSHVVSLAGRAFIEADARGHLAGKQIDISLVRPAAAAAAANSTYQVDQLDATGEVVMGNSSQTVRVNGLHLKFLYPDKPTPPGQNALALSDSAGRPMRQLVSPPGAAARANTAAATPALAIPLNPFASSSASDSRRTPAASPPVLVLGKELHSQIIINPGGSWVDRLDISGPVMISRDGPPQPDVPAWRVEGSSLQLSSDTTNQVDVQIVGQPARISMGDGWMEGPVIRLNQRTGQIWMDQPGEFCVPGSLLGTRAPGQNIEWLEPIMCRWKGRMHFQGTTANLDGGVTIDGIARTAPDRLLFIGGTSEALELNLSGPMNFEQSPSSAASLKNIVLRRNVDIKTAQTDLHKRRISLEEIAVPELVYDCASNSVIGKGPGWLRSQHQSRGGLGALASSSAPSPGSPQNPAAQLQGMHLKFRDTLEARLTDKQLSFIGKVEVGTGPIANLEQVINLDAMRTLQPEQTVLNGDLLRIYDVTDIAGRSHGSTLAEGAWEFEAMGNVTFEGKRSTGDFAGKAYRITYAQAKELLIIKGDARVPADLQLQTQGAFEKVVLKVWSATVNTHTMRPEGQLELANGSQAIPRGQPTPENASPSLVNPGGPEATKPRPRNGVSDWLKPGR